MTFRSYELNQKTPEGITYLDLSETEMWHKPTEDVIAILSAIQPSVNTLVLSSNILGQKTPAEVAFIMKAIPPTVTTLGLSSNGLWREARMGFCSTFSWLALWLKSIRDLGSILIAISPSITSLDLSDNPLALQMDAHALSVMKAIPSSVNFLNLSDNLLTKKSEDQLKEISKCLPYVINIQCQELSQEKLAALNCYNGHGIKAIYQVLNKKLPNKSLEVMSFLYSGTQRDIENVLIKPLPPEENQWSKLYVVIVALFLASASVAMIAKDSDELRDIITLGFITGICFCLFSESNNNDRQNDFRPGL